MGCHGALNGFRVAHGLLAANPGARILLVCVELCSLHHQYTEDPQQLVANALFSDGAAAAILQGPAGSETAWRWFAQASHVLPGTANLMSWRIGDYGFEMTLSRQVPQVLHEQLPHWLDVWLLSLELTRADIGHWVIHPGGPRILDAVATSLALTDAQIQPSHEILASHGNMSSPTVLFIFDRIARTAQLTSSVGAAAGPQRCLMLAFGPGLTIEALLWAR
jgi:predicted naringenin-chalcone synthase